ncbi:MAG: hypothetical protein FJ137_22475 [Deltaproteobacteria bacterium]|nr:hypothetical protein [Deltaproteobacteria bacterium]
MTRPGKTSSDSWSAADESSFTTPLFAAGLEPRLVQACRLHFQLLRRWNDTHNLTRIVDPSEAAVRHYLDCALPVLTGSPPRQPFVDVGSGAGFPGLIAALVCREQPATLIEPARKRASFLTFAIGALGLTARVEPPRRDHPGSTGAGAAFDWVLSRATFSKTARRELWPYVAHGGQLWVWTTTVEQDTWRELVSTWPDATLRWHGYELAGVGERWIAILERSAATPEHSQPG